MYFKNLVSKMLKRRKINNVAMLFNQLSKCMMNNFFYGTDETLKSFIYDIMMICVTQQYTVLIPIAYNRFSKFYSGFIFLKMYEKVQNIMHIF